MQLKKNDPATCYSIGAINYEKKKNGPKPNFLLGNSEHIVSSWNWDCPKRIIYIWFKHS